MPTLDELFKKHNVTLSVSPQSTTRSKLLAQADRMIRTLEDYKVSSDLDGTSTKYWWAPQSNEGQRRVAMRYGGKIVENTSSYVEDNVDSVKAHIKVLRTIIEESDNETWADEEARREKK